MKLSIIIPVFNEQDTIAEIIQRVKAVPYHKEIMVVDDGSTDDTKKILKNIKDNSFQVFYHDRNYGKGRAIRTALERVSGDIILIQDADLEYNPQEYEKLLKPILEGRTKVVYGSRFRGEGKAMFFWHAVGNNLLTLVTNLLYDSTLTDMETCYKVFKKEVIKNISLKSNRFNIEPELTAKILKKGHRIYEIPISYTGREYRDGKKITWKDGVIAFWTLWKYRFFD